MCGSVAFMMRFSGRSKRALSLSKSNVRQSQFGILVDDIPRLVEDGRIRLRTAAHDGPAEFAARRQRAKQFFARARIFPGSVNLSRGLDLRRREAIRPIAFLAQQYAGIELAAGGIRDQSVLQSVRRVAGRQQPPGGSADISPRGMWLAGSFSSAMRDPQPHRGPVPRRAGDDAVEIVREHLRFLQRLPAAGRSTHSNTTAAAALP